MRELRIPAAELQRLVGNAIRARLRKEGFSMGAPIDDEPCLIPVNFDLAGLSTVECEAETAVWIIRQETDPVLAERMAASLLFHHEACVSRETAA